MTTLLVTMLAAAAADPEPVRFETADGVELVGDFWPGPKGKKSACVLVLDGVGESAAPDAVRDLAGRLNKDGFAVLAFDWRGQGRSTAVTPAFWDVPVNRRFVKGYKASSPPERVEFADFQRGYLPNLVNDAAAAKHLLDRRNDAGECNSSEVVVVGVGEGAAVGALWLGTEARRYRAFGVVGERASEVPEGRDVVGAVWLGLRPELEVCRDAPVLGWLRATGQTRRTRAAFLYEDGDAAAERFAGQCAAAFNRPGDKNKMAVGRPIKPDEAGKGLSLAEAADQVVRFADAIRDAGESPTWEEKRAGDKRYYWLVGRRPVVAKLEGERSLRPVPAALVQSP